MHAIVQENIKNTQMYSYHKYIFTDHFLCNMHCSKHLKKQKILFPQVRYSIM